MTPSGPSSQPAKFWTLQMRTSQQFRPGLGAPAEYVADAVDLTRETGFRKSLQEPLQRLDVRFGKGRPMHARLVNAHGAKRVQVGQNPRTVGLRVVFSHGLRSGCGYWAETGCAGAR